MSMNYTLSYRDRLSPSQARWHTPGDNVTPSNGWTQYSKTYLLEASKDKGVDNHGKPAENPYLHLRFFGDGEMWVDDVQLIEVKK